MAPYPGIETDADIERSNEEQGTDEVAKETKKKKFDGDKVVVGFVPSTVKRKGVSKGKKGSGS